MNAVEFKSISTRTAVLRAMLFADSSVSCAQIAKDAGVSTNAAGASLRRLRDDGIVCSVDGDAGATSWYLHDPEAVRRMLDNDGTPGDGEPVPEPGDTQAVDAVEAARLITAAYSAAIAAESAADSAPPAGDDVCSADAVIAEWKREHAPAAPTIAPADDFDRWLADTKAGCAGQRAIDAAKQEAERLRAEAAEMVREAAEALEFGLIVAEIIRFADQRNASTSTSEAEFGLAELMAAAYEAVTGKRVA